MLVKLFQYRLTLIVLAQIALQGTVSANRKTGDMRDSRAYRQQSHPGMELIDFDRKVVLNSLDLLAHPKLSSAVVPDLQTDLIQTDRQILSHTLQLITDPRVFFLVRIPFPSDILQGLL